MRRIGAALATFALLIVLARVADLVVGWAWFSSLGYVDVFWTRVMAKLSLFAGTFAVSTLLLWANAAQALRLASGSGAAGSPALWPTVAGVTYGQGSSMPINSIGLSYKTQRLSVLLVSVALGVAIAAAEATQWDVALRFLYQAPYGTSDPLFGKDIGFYLFSLPAYAALKNWFYVLLVAAGFMTAGIYVLHGDIEFDPPRWRAAPAAIAHAAALLGVFFVIKAFSYFLDRYLLLYDDNGVFFGAGWADVHAELPAIWLLIACALGAATVCFAGLRWRSALLPIGAALALVSAALIFGEAIPGFVERLYVEPSQLQLEKPYIARAIAFTREAYKLGEIAAKPFPVEPDLSAAALAQDSATVRNIRLWDWRPLLAAYEQLQEIRTYYRFLDVEVDRYQLGETSQQVMVSGRELVPAQLPANAQTWVNLHLLFTHGLGAVMSPVTRKSPEGAPIFYLEDIPPVANGGPSITQPRIYFGESNADYAIVRSGMPEFDYPKGQDNAYTRYDGADGVPIGELLWRALFAWDYGDLNILLSRYVTLESRILIRRNIRDRIRAIAPFLRLDNNPYLVVEAGRLFWIQDAYTTSDWFPYAAPSVDGASLNYIRNSVKIVVDAYNGAVEFFVFDPADPIVATYERIFPTLFKPRHAMPPDLRSHVRYPEDLFAIQARQFSAYHMNSPEVFYNREDLWKFPREATEPEEMETGDAGAQMSPYYIMMRLPGEARTEFFLMLPMTPSRRENMIAWLAARCDPPDYGKLIIYEFPKDKLVYGPYQIEALINQNTQISQQISLWNQMGSRVIRGTLLAVPIRKSLLYVSPLYLRARSGQLPQLKRVIAAFGERVVMERTLPEALAALFEQTAPSSLPSTSAPEGPADRRGQQALAEYDRALERLKAGDWAGFGRSFDALRGLIEQLGGGSAADQKGSP
jgi:uncharacterized membrane protein (UPF0182 family)